VCQRLYVFRFALSSLPYGFTLSIHRSASTWKWFGELGCALVDDQSTIVRCMLPRHLICPCTVQKYFHLSLTRFDALEHHLDDQSAVEVLEQGRTLIWTQMARFRTPLDSLLEHGDHAPLVKKFREVSSLLDEPPAQLPGGTPNVQREVEAMRYSRLVNDWNSTSTVQEIRTVEGFSRFMLPLCSLIFKMLLVMDLSLFSLQANHFATCN
jgi:hypothetical protein